MATRHDSDTYSEITGCTIAEIRALIKFFSYYKKTTKETLKVFNHLYSNMQTSKSFNPKSYETKMLKRTIAEQNSILEIINDEIIDLKEYLKTYIKYLNKENKDKTD